MITFIIEACYYCCFGPRKKEPNAINLLLDNIEDLAEHELKYLLDKFTQVHQKKKNLCC